MRNSRDLYIDTRNFRHHNFLIWKGGEKKKCRRGIQAPARASFYQLHNFTMPSTYKKEKPWDTDDIDKWKVNYSFWIK